MNNKSKIAVFLVMLWGLSFSAGHAQEDAQDSSSAVIQSDTVDPITGENSTIVYPAEYFAPYSPNSVSDMLGHTF